MGGIRQQWEFNVPMRLNIFDREFEAIVLEFRSTAKAQGMTVNTGQSSIYAQSKRRSMSLRAEKAQPLLVVDILHPGRGPKSTTFKGEEAVLEKLRLDSNPPAVPSN